MKFSKRTQDAKIEALFVGQGLLFLSFNMMWYLFDQPSVYFDVQGAFEGIESYLIGSNSRILLFSFGLLGGGLLFSLIKFRLLARGCITLAVLTLLMSSFFVVSNMHTDSRVLQIMVPLTTYHLCAAFSVYLSALVVPKRKILNRSFVAGVTEYD